MDKKGLIAETKPGRDKKNLLIEHSFRSAQQRILLGLQRIEAEMYEIESAEASGVDPDPRSICALLDELPDDLTKLADAAESIMERIRGGIF